MSVNDPDGEPYKVLTKEEFIACLVRMGFKESVAEREWENFDQPVYECDLRW